MKNEKRHEMNIGAQAVIKHLRGRISTLVRKGVIPKDTAGVLRLSIRESIAACSKRKGGLGRK